MLRLVHLAACAAGAASFPFSLSGDSSPIIPLDGTSSSHDFRSLAGSTLRPVDDSSGRVKTVREARMALDATPSWQASFGKRSKYLHSRRDQAGRQYFGQFKEDCAMHVFMEAAGLLADKKPRVFLEMGALNGLTYSNSLFFEKELGWSGLLIEASPHNCNGLQLGRRSGRTVNLCLGICPAGEGPLEFLAGRSPATFHMVAPLPSNASAQERAGRVRVPCRPLGHILKSLRVPALDYFSLDVEGAEALVMSTYDWSVPVHVLQWEESGSRKAVSAQMRALLKQHGMRDIGKNGLDAVFVSKEVFERVGRDGARVAARFYIKGKNATKRCGVKK